MTKHSKAAILRRRNEFQEQVQNAKDANPGPFPKDPECPEDMNEDRASWAESCMEKFAELTGSDLGDAVSDLLADLGHFCDRVGLNVEREFYRAADHYDVETGGIGKQFGVVSNNPLA